MSNTVNLAGGMTYQPAQGTDQGENTEYLAGLGNSQPGGSAYLTQFGQTQGGANSYSNQLAALGGQMAGQQAQTPGQTQFAGSLAGDYSQYAAAQQQQLANLQALQKQASGQAVNPAAAQMAQGAQQATAQQGALAHSAGIGGGGALAARNAGNAGAAIGINNANATAASNAEFQAQGAAAYQNAANAYAQQQQAWQKGQQGFAGDAAALQQQQQTQNMQNQLAAYGQAQDVQNAQLAAGTSQSVVDQGIQGNTINAVNNANQANLNGAIGGVTQVGGAILGFMSDERLKRDIRSESLADKFMAHLHPYSYRYSDPADAPNGDTGRYMGVMAQDVERAPGGKQLVQNTPRGKALSVPATVSALAAGVGRLHERLKALEESRARGEDPDAAE